MKYLEASFTSGANSKAFRDNYDKVFRKPRPKKKAPVATEVFRGGVLPEPENERGYPWSQLEREMHPAALEVFGEWMRGQTVGVCPETNQAVVYAWDLERWVSQTERCRRRGIEDLPRDQDLSDWD